MKTNVQFAIATLISTAILIVFICPLTYGPPAPQQSKWELTPLLAVVFGLWVLPLMLPAAFSSLWEMCPDEQHSTSHRLALICTRLC